MKAEFNDPDNTNFIVDVRLRARSEDQIDDSILESDELLPGLLPPILTDSRTFFGKTSYQVQQGRE
jgi:hypothetical protein